ncbi:Sister chromatid cohesion protein 2 [Apophysomyces sp. BC1015]|nr:Sister chromatid cohesion protein 2 [Apophysomyces sp. BC1015]
MAPKSKSQHGKKGPLRQAKQSAITHSKVVKHSSGVHELRRRAKIIPNKLVHASRNSTNQNKETNNEKQHDKYTEKEEIGAKEKENEQLQTDSESEEEDDIPLNQRSAVMRKKIDNTEIKEDSTQPNSDTDLTMDTLQNQSQAVLKKLSHCLDDLCNSFNSFNEETINDNDQAIDDNVNIRLPPLQSIRKFTSLALKAAQHKCIQDVDMAKFSRILRSMERIISAAADLDILSRYSELLEKRTDAVNIAESITSMLELISAALETSGMMFDILTACKFNKQILSESTILNSLRVVRMQLENTIYPLIDLRSFEDDVTSLNNDVRSFLALVESTSSARMYLSCLLPLTTRFLRRASILLQQDEIDDSAVILIAYISMGPFFHDYSDGNVSCLLTTANDTTTANAYEQLKFSALDMLKTLFSTYPQHRRWILEELLTSVSTLTTMDRAVKRFRLRDNTTIHVMTALFMHLIQCCCIVRNVGEQNTLRKWGLRQQRLQKDSDTKQLDEHENKLVKRASDIWKSSIEAATQNASFLLEFLLSKCKSRKRDAYSVAEYRLIMESMMDDVLVVLNDPEWPVAQLIMRVFSKILVVQIESQKSDVYLKSLAIDWLGIIAGRIKSGINRLSGGYMNLTPEWVYQLNAKLPFEADHDTPVHSLRAMYQCQMSLFQNIDDKADLSVGQFYLCQWGYSNALTWGKAREPDEDIEWSSESTITVRDMVKEAWHMCLGMNIDVPERKSFLDASDFNYDDIKILTELLATRGPLYKSYKFLLSQIIGCLDHSVVTFRTKALRSLGRIAADTPDVLDEAHIRNAVIRHIHDNSPSVRDAAVEVVAKYLGSRSDVPVELYKTISGRISDTAGNVRKRMVKLLRGLYTKCDDRNIKIDIASKLIQRISDDDITISELALKATQEVMFYPFRDIENDKSDYFGYTYGNAPKERKRRIVELTGIITVAVAKSDSSAPDSDTSLAQIVEKTMKTCDEKTRSWYEKIFQWVVDALFERMLLLDESGERENFIHCLATTYSFTKTCPNLLRESHISMLQPYLSIKDEEDLRIARHVLMIYRDILPRMKSHDREFIELMEKALMRLWMGGPLEMERLTLSIEKLKGDRNSIISTGVPIRPANIISKMLLSCGSLCQNFDFDERKKESTEEKVAVSAFRVLQYFANDTISQMESGIEIRMAALQSLGYLFATYPTLMILETNTSLLDHIFQMDTETMKTQLMKVFKGFLAAEETRLGKQEKVAGSSLYEKVIDIDTLLGNTEEFAELGVNGSLMQRYLRDILKCALDKDMDLRYSAFEVVTAVVHQGLAHPVLCMAAIVAAETSPDLTLRNKAYCLHKFAHDKYGTLLYSNLIEYMNAAFEYQILLFGDHVKGYGAVTDTKTDALFGLTYDILKPKKKVKLNFLETLVKPFAFDLKAVKADELDIRFFCFMADNMLTLELTSSEEVLCILSLIDRVQMTVGTDVLSYLQYLEKRGVIGTMELDSEDKVEDDTDCMDPDYTTAAKASAALYILLYVRCNMMNMYNISERELQENDSNERNKSRSVLRNIDADGLVNWSDELLYVRTGKMNLTSARDAYEKFQKMMMDVHKQTLSEDEEE